MRRLSVKVALLLGLISALQQTPGVFAVATAREANDLDPGIQPVVKRSLDDDDDYDSDLDLELDAAADAPKEEKKPTGNKLKAQSFEEHWPPTGPDGEILTEDEAGQEKWQKIRDDAIQEYKNYETMRDEELKGVKDADGKPISDTEIKRLSTPTRGYPFCVDGYKPKDDCPGKETTKKCIDEDLERFMPFFDDDLQPPKGPLISDVEGKPNIPRLVNGEDIGSYIKGITFTKLISPPPPIGISSTESDASRELPFWIHIIVTSRKELSGLYIQAIGAPMGLPFGNFRDDFDCNAGADLIQGETVTPVTAYNPDLNKRYNKARRTNIIPCKYSHGSNNGDMYPNVFAYGGRKEPKLPKKKVFRVHFSWSSTHCNLKTRVQFLVLAVASFDKRDVEIFLTPNYLLNQNNAAGSPPPYIHGSSSDFGWDGQMQCNEKNVQTTPSTRDSDVVLVYDKETSNLPILYDADYDKCITDDKDDSNFFFDEGKKTPKAERFEAPPDSRKNRICPPATLCMNEKPGEITYNENGQPTNANKKILENAKAIQKKAVPTCRLRFCPHPDSTVPVLDVDDGINDGGNDADDTVYEKPDEATQHQLDVGGTRFSAEFTRQLFKSGTLHFRKVHGTHVWCLTLAWFILMALGTFVARYYKETGGINANTGNSILGLGCWIWVHILLFFLSLTFMWVGILETARFRQKSISCNMLQVFGDFSMKNFCRWKKKIVRNHRKIGIAAAAFYHVALAISWARPVRKLRCGKCCRIPMRQIFLWVHVLFAYIGKILCIVSIALFFSTKAQSICVRIPLIVVVTEAVSLFFFVAGWVLQCLEDTKLKKTMCSRRVFPVPEALEPADSSPCYWIKVVVVVVSTIIHIILFVVVILIAHAIYIKPSKNINKVGFEDDDHGIGGKCKIVSAKAELDAAMAGYYYRKTGPADSAN